MAKKRTGLYKVGNQWKECVIIRTGGKRTRIENLQGDQLLLPNSDVEIGKREPEVFQPQRIVPQVALERLYRRLRKLKGSKLSKYQKAVQSITPFGEANTAEYLTSLFLRSIDYAKTYANADEPFYTDRKPRSSDKAAFANHLVEVLSDNEDRIVANTHHAIKMLDYEIYPFRSTRSFTEDGRPATSLGSGGLDLLLLSDIDESPLPAVGEIKGAQEQVGPTFALIQSLMYASQLLTQAQFQRLKNQYQNELADIDVENPRMDLILLLEESPNLNQEDLQFAVNLANQLLTDKVSQHLRCIRFLWCSPEGDLQNINHELT